MSLNRLLLVGTAPLLLSTRARLAAASYAASSDHHHRVGCEKGLKSVYRLNFASFKSLDEAGPLSVAALKNSEVQVVEALDALSAKLTTTQVSKLNLLVTGPQEAPAALAQTWLKHAGLG